MLILAIEQDVKAMQARIMNLSQKAGVSYDDAAKAVNQSVETARAAERGMQPMSVRDALVENGTWRCTLGMGLPRRVGGLQKDS